MRDVQSIYAAVGILLVRKEVCQEGSHDLIVTERSLLYPYVAIDGSLRNSLLFPRLTYQ